MRRLDYLITQARGISGNEVNSDGTVALPQSFFVQAANDAQDRLQGLISALKSQEKAFISDVVIPLVAGQESYAIPDRLFMNRGVHLVEYSHDSTAQNYYPLRKLNYFNRDTSTAQYLSGHSVRNGRIWVTPIPSASVGSLRVSYEQSLDDLDIRRGTVSGVVYVGTTLSSVTFSTDVDESSTINISNIDYVCFVDRDGNRRTYNISVASWTSGTRTLVFNAFTPTALDPGVSAGHFVTFGKYTTTHSQLPDDAEPYLIHYMAQAALNKDSSSDWVNESEILMGIEKSILRAFMSQTANVERIPEQNEYDW